MTILPGLNNCWENKIHYAEFWCSEAMTGNKNFPSPRTPCSPLWRPLHRMAIIKIPQDILSIHNFNSCHIYNGVNTPFLPYKRFRFLICNLQFTLKHLLCSLSSFILLVCLYHLISGYSWYILLLHNFVPNAPISIHIIAYTSILLQPSILSNPNTLRKLTVIALILEKSPFLFNIIL